MIKQILLFLLAFLTAFLLVSLVIPNNMLEDRADDMSELFLAFAALSGTLLGFVISSMSILTGLRVDEAIDKLVGTGHYPVLMQNLFHTGVLLFMSMIFAIVSYFWDNVSIWKSGFALFVLSILTLGVVGFRFYVVMSFISKKRRKKSLWPESTGREDG